MKMRSVVLLAALLLGTVAPALAGSPAVPGKGPPDCPGTPGAFISAEAKDLVEAGTPPGQVVSGAAKANKGVGDTVKNALREDCGIGALPQED